MLLSATILVPVAQWRERRPHKPRVLGSSPSGRTSYSGYMTPYKTAVSVKIFITPC
jgi:hypothetical protein